VAVSAGVASGGWRERGKEENAKRHDGSHVWLAGGGSGREGGR
jgi:hypothetical protein